jgi:imidazole glycerol-phosphate synthase subunit HisH
MIAIIDYQMGNIASVENAFLKNGYRDVKITSDKDEIAAADKIVLPGVAAFGDTMANLNKLGLTDVILDFIKKGKPYLGLCVGMQLLFERSHENGLFDGLGVIKGEVVRFDIKEPVPHIGWNTVKMVNSKDDMFKDTSDGTYFFFDHSFYGVPEDKSVIRAVTEYETEFVSAVSKGNITATQFHPEKSSKKGLKLIENFAYI